MSGNLGTIPGSAADLMCNLGRGRMVLWSRRCRGTREGPLLFPVLPPDFLCNLGPVSLNLSRTLGKWGPPGCANREKVICACERIPRWWGMLKYPPRRVRLFPISGCQIACLRGGELFLQSPFRCLHGIKTPITIETSVISGRIRKPCSGSSKETNWWGGQGGSCRGLSVCAVYAGGRQRRDAAMCPWPRKDATHGSLNVRGHSAISLLSEISTCHQGL